MVKDFSIPFQAYYTLSFSLLLCGDCIHPFPERTHDILEDLRQLEQLAAAAHDFGTPASVSQIPGGAPLKRAGELLGDGGMCVRTVRIRK